MKGRKLVSMVAILLLMTGSIPPTIHAEVDDSGTPKKEEKKPELRGNMEGNYPRLDWAVEMADADVLYSTGFEEGDELPRLTYNSSGNRLYGGQSFTEEDRVSGLRSLKIDDSYTNGNYRQEDMKGNVSYLTYSWASFNDRKYLKNGTDLSVSFWAKSTGEGSVRLQGIGGAADFGEPTPYMFLEDVSIGDKTVKVSNPEVFKGYVDRGQRYYIADRKGLYSYNHVVSVDVANSTITLSGTFKGEFEKGEPILKHNHRSPVSFGSREISKDGQWELYNVNTKVADYKDYNTLVRGIYLVINGTTHKQVYMDDMKMGYATKSQLFRDGVKVYEGNLSDYLDTGATDTEKPNPVNGVEIKEENGKHTINVVKPEDNGSTYTYLVKSLAHDGSTNDSNNVDVESVSGIKGYSYVVDKKKTTEPNNKVNSTTGVLDVAGVEDGEQYLHIKAVDGAGNVSGTTHYRIQVPSLHVNQEGLTPKVTWAVEMADEDILYQSGFEDGDELPDLVYGVVDKAGGRTGGQEFTNTQAFTGSKSLSVTDTYTNGQQVGNPDIYGNPHFANFSRARFLNRKYVNNGTDLTLSMRVKSNEKGSIEVTSASEIADYGTPMKETFITDVKKGDKVVQVSDVKVFKSSVEKGQRFYLAGNKGRYTNLPFVVAIDEKTNTITLDKGFSGDFSAGDNLLQHAGSLPVNFGSQTVDGSGKWELYGFSSKVADTANYNALIRGFVLALHTTTKGTVYIDDLKMGYATKSQLYRGNDKVYEGFLTDFQDSKATDKAKPDSVDTATVGLKDGKIAVTVQKPKDNGTKYHYRVQSLAHDGTTVPSVTKDVNVVSELAGYAVVIDSNPTTVPGTKVTQVNDEWTLPPLKEGKNYLHIRAIDKAGNVSEVTHFEIAGGELAVAVPTVNDFEDVTIQKEPVAIGADIVGDVRVTNTLVTQKGWRLSVSASPLESKESGYRMGAGTLWLNPPNKIEKMTKDSGEVPEIKMTRKMEIDREKVTVTSSASEAGLGDYAIKFHKKAVEILIDPTTMRVDTNKAGATQYETTLTWEIVTAP